MLNPTAIISWLRSQTNSVRLSRLKTFAALVSAASQRMGVGVLPLGRVMRGQTTAKHRIKRVFRFFKNRSLELSELQRVLFITSLPAKGPIIILIDWTDMPPFRTLCLALPRDGRAIPFFNITIPIKGKGGMMAAEQQALAFLQQHLPARRQVIVVGDRGFGTVTWVNTLHALGYSYVLRLRTQVEVCSDSTFCKLRDMKIRRRQRPRSLGMVTITASRPTTVGLVSHWGQGHSEPWYLITDMHSAPGRAVKLYKQRMWIELAFRDMKNRKWGLGLADVRLSEAARMDRLIMVVIYTYVLMLASGAAAERWGNADNLKANTANTRALNPAIAAFYLLKQIKIPLPKALKLLKSTEHT